MNKTPTIFGEISTGGTAKTMAAMWQIANLGFFMWVETNMCRTLNAWNALYANFAWITFFEKFRIDCKIEKTTNSIKDQMGLERLQFYLSLESVDICTAHSHRHFVDDSVKNSMFFRMLKWLRIKSHTTVMVESFWKKQNYFDISSKLLNWF